MSIKGRLEKLENNNPIAMNEEDGIKAFKENAITNGLMSKEDIEKIDWEKLYHADQDEIDKAYNILYPKHKEKEVNADEEISGVQDVNEQKTKCSRIHGTGNDIG